MTPIFIRIWLMKTSRQFDRATVDVSLRSAWLEHDADLHTNLVDEDEQAVRSGDRRRELAERLAHEARLDADVAVAHVALDFCLGHERSDRIDDDEVDGIRPDEHVGDLESLLAVIGLADEELLGLHPELAGVRRVEGVLRVDERRHPAGLLHLGDRVERERGLPARFGSVDLDDAPARVTADAEGDIEADAARRDDLNPFGQAGALFEAHDRALAVFLFDGRDGELDGLALVLGVVHGRPLGLIYTVSPFSFQPW
jgi:hypothetical protein